MVEAVLNKILDAQAVERVGAQRCFQGAIWHCCQVHFMRNVPSHTSSKHQKEIGEVLAEVHEEWQGRRYRDMTDFYE